MIHLFNHDGEPTPCRCGNPPYKTITQNGSYKNKCKNCMTKYHKFKAKPSEHDGIKFPSKLERDCYLTLKELQKSGKILFFLRQTPFDLPAARHRVDFQVFTPTQVLFIESKGRDLSQGKLMREQVEALYPVRIWIVTKPEQIPIIIGASENGSHLAAPESDC